MPRSKAHKENAGLGVGLAVAVVAAVSATGCTGNGETSVGEVTKVPSRNAYLGEKLARRGNNLFSKALLTTDYSGTVEFELDSGTSCLTRRNSKLKIEPRSGIRIHFLSGKSYCAKEPDAPDAAYRVGDKLLIRAKDPVFAVAVKGQETLVQVTLGFVEVATEVARVPVIVGPNQQAVVSSEKSVPRVEKSELSRGENVIAEALEERLPPPESFPPPNLGDRLVLAVDPAASRSVRSFIRGFAGSLENAWNVSTRMELLRPGEAESRLQEGTIDILVSPDAVAPGGPTVPLFSKDGITWGLALTPDATYERSLSDFVSSLLLTGEYRSLYVESFGFEPKYKRAGRSVLVDVGRAPVGTLFSTLPDDLVAEAAGPEGTRVQYVAPSLRPDAPEATVTCSPPPGSLFPIGTETVTCSAETPGGLEERASFTITVRDTSEPTLNIRNPVEHEAETKDGARVEFAITASDQVDGVFEATCTPASGTHFSTGTHDVTCTATDAAGKTARGSFTVTVKDSAPILTVPANISRPYTNPTGTRVFYRPASAYDRVDGTLTATCIPRSGSLFRVRPTTVTCSATDSAGQRTERSFIVEIIDDIPPLLTVPPSHAELAPVRARTHVVTFPTSAVDAVDGIVPVECDPESGSALPVGRTTVVLCTATDRSRNRAEERFSITVTAPS